MGRLRQMDREVEVARQAEMEKRVGREVVKRTESGEQRVIEKRQTDRGPDLQRCRKIKMDRQIPRT